MKAAPDIDDAILEFSSAFSDDHCGGVGAVVGYWECLTSRSGLVMLYCDVKEVTTGTTSFMTVA